MYKVICLDLDGTLLDDKKIISKLNLKILDDLQGKGIEIVIATGRGLTRIEQLTSSMKFPHIIIANNGAIAKLNFSDNILFYNSLDRNIFNEIVKVSKKFSMMPYLHIFDLNGEKSLVIPNEILKENHIKSVKDISEIAHYNEINDRDLDNILSAVFIDKENKILGLNKEILSLKLDISTHILTNTSENRLLSEYLNPLAQKSIGINEYLKFKGYKWSEVVSFGDDNNDLDMIKSSGLGICMKNGSSLLKLNSRYISQYTNNEDGVARELIKIFGGILNE
ncbi:Cof-type HAD-IIB family hydrolase [Miniphocaeibacter massiliensis]|uniref:Cof-type HAD-IIB family hydrolase n=1 Tax=Miniphocaeibacter massiliensis TaxID=2041841 RepID=UPI000C08CE61|nr:Cof-type HAD-IIB family hydrolase [Miniphocaeibacter massiliensis]